MKLLHLRGRKTCDYVLRKGRVWRGKTMTVHWLPGAPRRPDNPKSGGGMYVGTFASAKVSKSAPERNRMRRRIREALRTEVQEIGEMSAVQLLLTPRSGSLEAPFSDVQSDIRTFLTQLPSWPQKKDR